MCDRAYHITGVGCTGEVCTNSQGEKGQCTVPKRLAMITTKKYTSVMMRVCHTRSRFLSCMYIHEKFMTESR